MNILDNVIVNVIYITFPLLCYLFYIAHNKDFSKKNNELFFEIAIFTSIYLCLKLGTSSYLLVSIPLLICFLKKRKVCSILFPIMIISYSNSFFEYNILLIIIENILCYCLFLLYYNNKLNNKIFITIFLFIHSITNILINNNLLISIISSIIYILIALLILYMLKKSYDIANIHMSIKEIEKEKQIRNSLFKITHEIKNPIAVCKGYLDMFDKDNPKHLKFIPIIKTEINRTLTIMNDFMEFSKIKLDLEIMDIELLLEEVLNTLSNLLDENNIKLEYEIQDDEIYINGDYDRLKQVFINIIKNSVEALENICDAKIVVNYKIIDNKIIINIKDNGVGMNDEVKSKIFEAFYTTKKCGTGLGISLSKEIIDGHKGTIIYESEENFGTTVKITLPIINLT